MKGKKNSTHNIYIYKYIYSKVHFCSFSQGTQNCIAFNKIKNIRLIDLNASRTMLSGFKINIIMIMKWIWNGVVSGHVTQRKTMSAGWTNQRKCCKTGLNVSLNVTFLKCSSVFTLLKLSWNNTVKLNLQYIKVLRQPRVEEYKSRLLFARRAQGLIFFFFFYLWFRSKVWLKSHLCITLRHSKS